ncbi:13795_t:CDS:2, partial [Racocetra fulgida]
MCSKRRSEKRKQTNQTDLNMTVPTISTSSSRINNASDFLQINNILENYNSEPVLEANYLFDDEFANVVEITKHNDDNTLTYCMDKVEQFVSMQFQNAESSDEPTKFVFEIELDKRLLDTRTVIPEANSDLKNPVAEELYEKEINNDNFIKNFDTLVGLFVKAVNECEEALQAHRQQGTQKSNNKKLDFWL